MRLLLWLLLGLPPVPTINDLDLQIQVRFETPPLPNELGMSRIARPSSMGRPFEPILTTKRDFHPENAAERKVIAGLEAQRIEVGLYLFGQAIEHDGPELLNYRALKGPAAVTKVTDRAALPDWNTMYPLARRAMNSFEDGGQGFETTQDSWQIVLRPVMAKQRTCTGCHAGVTLGKPVGGVLYAFRQVP